MRDLRDFVAGQLAQRSARELLGVGPRRVGVRVVAFEHDVVDADAVANFDCGRIIDGAEPEVAAEDLGRQDAAGQFHGGTGVRRFA